MYACSKLREGKEGCTKRSTKQAHKEGLRGNTNELNKVKIPWDWKTSLSSPVWLHTPILFIYTHKFYRQFFFFFGHYGGKPSARTSQIVRRRIEEKLQRK